MHRRDVARPLSPAMAARKRHLQLQEESLKTSHAVVEAIKADVTDEALAPLVARDRENLRRVAPRIERQLALIRRFTTRPQRTSAPLARGRDRGARRRRRTVRAGSTRRARAPGRLPAKDDDPPERLDVVCHGLAVASSRLLVHLRRREAKAVPA
jgi:hypothetical protein